MVTHFPAVIVSCAEVVGANSGFNFVDKSCAIRDSCRLTVRANDEPDLNDSIAYQALIER